MDVSSIASTGATTTQPQGDAFSDLSSEDFVKIIFTELQAQDPLAPNDTSAVMEQISTLRSIQSDIELTDKLEAIVSQNQLASAGGLIGAFVVLVLFCIILWRGMRIALATREQFSALLALGITLLITLQAFINMSVVTGILPTKGTVLPLVSFGGSSLVVTLAALGVLLNISRDVVKGDVGMRASAFRSATRYQVSRQSVKTALRKKQNSRR